MYRDTPEFMYPAAARSVLAAMENLVRKGQVVVQGEGLTLRVPTFGPEYGAITVPLEEHGHRHFRWSCLRVG